MNCKVPRRVTCSVCGKRFTTSNSVRKVCSNECAATRNAAYRKAFIQKQRGTKDKVRKCAICENTFVSNMPQKKTCDEECAKELSKRYARKYMYDRYHSDGEFRRKMIDANCLIQKRKHVAAAAKRRCGCGKKIPRGKRCAKCNRVWRQIYQGIYRGSMRSLAKRLAALERKNGLAKR